MKRVRLRYSLAVQASDFLSAFVLLQRAGTLLEQSTQGCKEHLRAIDEFVDILVRKEVLAHKDKVCISTCLVCYLSTLLRNERCMFDSAIIHSWRQATCGLLICRMSSCGMPCVFAMCCVCMHQKRPSAAKRLRSAVHTHSCAYRPI